MDEGGAVLFLAFAFSVLLVAGPVLAVVALVRVLRLERRLRDAGMAGRLAAPESRPAAAAPVEPAAPRRAVEPAVVAAPPASPTPPPVSTPPGPRPTALHDWEALIAGRWMNRVGIVALLVAAALFLKFAFDNQWIGPTGRVAIGLVAGCGLVLWGEALRRRGYVYFSEGLAGLGVGVLYLSIYAAWSFYGLIGLTPAFAGMIFVTAATVAISIGRDSQRLALLALAGGFATPLLLSSGVDRQVVLFGYLLVLNASLIAVARFRSWRLVEPTALAATVFHVFAWYVTYYDASKLGATLALATPLFLEFAALPLLRARDEARLLPERIALVLANASWYGLLLHLLLYGEHRWALTFAVLGLGALYLAGAARLRGMADRTAARRLFGALALAFVTVAIPIRLEGQWIIIAWAVEGALLLASGVRGGVRPLRLAGYALMVVAAWMTLARPYDEAARFLLNGRFLTYAATAAALYFAVAAIARAGEAVGADERRGALPLSIAANLLALVALSREVWDLAGRAAADDRLLGQQLGLSALWAVAAAALIAAGIVRHLSALRWQGILLMTVTAGKVFLIDLSALQRGFRILSFCILGGLLLVVSFYYQRRLGTRHGAEGP